MEEKEKKIQEILTSRKKYQNYFPNAYWLAELPSLYIAGTGCLLCR